MPRTERNFEESFKNLKRDVAELKRNSQASMVGYVDNETGKIKDIVDNIDVDTRVPAAPVEVVADSFVYESYNAKRRQGYITLTSAPVVNATDASPIEVGRYEMWLRPAGYASEEEAEPFTLQGTAIKPSLRSLPVELGKPYEVIMRAMTITGRPGLFSEVKTQTVVEDTAPPPMPSALTLTQSLGVVDMAWDGLSFGETLMPQDFWRTEVGVRWGEDAQYTLTGEQFEEAGIRYYGKVPFNTPLFFAHRSQDYAGNYSEWSQPASIVVPPLVDNEEIARRLDDAESRIDLVAADLQTTGQQLTDRLDQAQVDLDAAESNLNNLNTVVIPGINQTLANTQSELDQTSAQLTGRLDDAFTEIDGVEAQVGLKGRIFKGTAVPTATSPKGTAVGDLYRRLDASGNVIMDYQWSGTGWVAQAVTSAAISNLEVGKLIATGASISTAVIDKLWAEVITARKISVSQLMVGSFDNLCPDPSFESFDLPEFSGGSVWTDDNAGGAEFTRDPGARTGSAWLRTTRATAGLVNSFYNRALIQVNGGDTFKFGLWYKVLSGTGSARVRIYEYGANGQYIRSSLTGGDELTADGWTRSSATRTIAADARYIRIRAQITVGDASQVAVDDMYCNRMTDGSIVVNGSITGDHLEVNSVAAKVATVMKLDVGNLVASSATINNAVIDKLWTDVIRARQISADQINIGSGNNIVPNASFMNEKAWDGFGYAPESRAAFITGTKTLRTPSFPVEGGVPYIFKMKALSEVASRLYVQIIHNGEGSNPYVVNNFNFAPVGTVWLWRDFSVEFTLPEGATSAQIAFYGNHSAGEVTTGTQWYKDVGIYPMTDASLVVDGAILARHITASESMSAKLGQFLTVEADMIAANAVTAAKIAGGAIDGKIITGATVRTSSASSRVEMNSTGLHAWKSGVKTFFLESSTGEFSAVGSIQTGSDLTYRAKLSNRDGLAALDIYAAGGDSANHAALIAWEDSLALRRYTSATAYNGELSMGSSHVQLANSSGVFSVFSTQTKASHSSGAEMVLSSGATTLTHSNGTSLVSLGTVSQMSHANGNLYMSSSYFQFGKTNDGYLRFDSSKTTLGNRVGAVMLTEVDLSGTYTIQMPMVTASKTTQGANVNVNVGYLREVSSASRYKLMTEAMDESLDDKLLQIEAKTWVDRSNAEIYSQALTPTQEGEDRVPVPTDCLRRIPGVIAEEVLAAGLDEFVIFDEDGEIEGVMYDRLGVALIPVVSRLRDRVVALEQERGSVLARLEALESATV